MRSKSFFLYPVTAVYLGGVTVVVLVSESELDFAYGLLALTLVTLVAVMIAAWRELRTVHRLVNSQRDELLERIEVLVDCLRSSGVQIPATEQHYQDEAEAT